MDSWVLKGQVLSGAIEVYVGLSSETVSEGGHLWKASGSPNHPVRIAKKTSDKDFHLATWYYIYIEGGSVDSEVVLTLE